MIFFDASVIVAASTAPDLRHEACIAAMELARGEGACSLHTLAEIFSVLTGRPGPIRMAPDDAVQIVSHLRKRLTTISLTPAEYEETMRSLAKAGQSGGMVYDALLLACARKAKAKKIYTLNPRHFRVAAPDLAARIMEP